MIAHARARKRARTHTHTHWRYAYFILFIYLFILLLLLFCLFDFIKEYMLYTMLVIANYENTPIQIYWEFYHTKMKIFRWKILIFFLFLLKT